MSAAPPSLLGIGRRALEIVCMVCLVLLVLVTSVDVLGRYAFNAPFAPAFSLARILMALMVFAALPLASSADEHLRAGLFDANWSGAGLRWRGIVVHAVSTLACAVLAWRLGAQTSEYAANGELIEVLDVRAAWVVGVLSVLAVAGTVACATLFVRALAAPANGAAPSLDVGPAP